MRRKPTERPTVFYMRLYSVESKTSGVFLRTHAHAIPCPPKAHPVLLHPTHTKGGGVAERVPSVCLTTTTAEHRYRIFRSDF